MTRPRVRPRAWLLATAAGLALFASHPPVGAWPAVFLVVPLFLAALLEVDRARAQLAVGFVTGVVGYGLMLTWVALPAGYVGWILLSLVEGAFVAVLAWLIGRWAASPWIVLVAPVGWTGMEVWRSLAPLGGFGWGELAYAHVDGSWMLPLARLLGGHAITLATAVLGAMLFDAYRRGRVAVTGLEGTTVERLQAALPHARPALLGLAGVLLVTVLATVEPPAEDGPVVDVLAVQGNDPDLALSSGGRDEDLRIARSQLALTRAAVEEGGPPDLTVWPESSLDRDPLVGPPGDPFREILTEAATVVEGGLLVGTNLEGPRPLTFANSAVVVDGRGEAVDRYVKRRLVPFGEFVPWRSVLGDLPPLRQVPRDALPGPGPQSLDVDPVRVAVLICFETLFPDVLRTNVLAAGEPAGLVVAITNDVSFGRSAEPAQHLAQSRLRAVESGRWVVHASLAGRSAFVDPEGEVHDVTALFDTATARRSVPTVTGRTPFLAIGDVVGIAAMVAYLLLAAARVAATVRRRRQEPPT